MKDKKECKDYCGENTCGGGGHSCGGTSCGCGGWCAGSHRHGLLRIALLIAIVVMVFSMGVRVGEFKGEFGGSYGRHSMMRGSYYGGGTMMDPNVIYNIPVQQ